MRHATAKGASTLARKQRGGKKKAQTDDQQPTNSKGALSCYVLSGLAKQCALFLLQEENSRPRKRAVEKVTDENDAVETHG